MTGLMLPDAWSPMIDAEDRRFLATWGIRLIGLFAGMISVAGVLGLAVRVFFAAAG